MASGGSRFCLKPFALTSRDPSSSDMEGPDFLLGGWGKDSSGVLSKFSSSCSSRPQFLLPASERVSLAAAPCSPGQEWSLVTSSR